MRAIARINLDAWLMLAINEAIMWSPPRERAAYYHEKYVKGHTKSLKTEKDLRFAVVLDDELEAEDVEPGQTLTSAVGAAPPAARASIVEGEVAPLKGRVIAGIKYYLVAADGPHPDAGTQEIIDAMDTRQEQGMTRLQDENAKGHQQPHLVAERGMYNQSLEDHFVAGIVNARIHARSILGTHVLIDNLYTDPSHHRRGAGALLMKEATRYADELGLWSMLEASPAGRRLYEKCGFELQDDQTIWVDLKRWEDGVDRGAAFSEERLRENGGEPTPENGWYALHVMFRPPQANNAATR